MSGAPLKNLHMFAKLCGDGAIKNVVLATTMWSKVKPEIGSRREVELQTTYWRGMLDLGSRMMRFEDSFEAAWNMIDEIVTPRGDSDSDHARLLQEELVDLGRRLSETGVGKTLYTRLRQVRAQQKATICKLREEVEKEQNEHIAREMAMQCEAVTESLQSTYEQLATMKIPLRRRVVMLFTLRKSRTVSSFIFFLSIYIL